MENSPLFYILLGVGLVRLVQYLGEKADEDEAKRKDELKNDIADAVSKGIASST